MSAAAAACERGTKRRFANDDQEGEMESFKKKFGSGAAKKSKTEERPATPTVAAASVPLAVVSELDKKKTALEEAEEAVKRWSKEVEDTYQDWKKESDSKKAEKKEKIWEGAKEREGHFSAQVKELKAEIAAAAGVTGRKKVFAEKMDVCLQDMNELPSLVDLSALLLEEMHTALPLEPDLVRKLHDRASVHSTLESDVDKVGFIVASKTETIGPLEDFLRHIAHMDFHEKVAGGSEDQVHMVMDLLVQEPIRLLMRTKNVDVELGRNASEKEAHTPTTMNGLRPDFLLHVKNLLFFRGEEKRDGIALTEAANELHSKMPKWNPAVLGRLPYVLGYAAAGTSFQLYALHPTSEEVAPTVIMTPIGKQLDLSHVMDALTLIRYVFVIARVIVRASKDIPENVPPVGKVWERKSGRHAQITIENEFVKKRLVLDEDLPIFKWNGDGGLKELYDLVKQQRIVGTIQLRDVEVSSLEIVLYLAPLGYRDPPKNMIEVKKLLLDVLRTLQSIHANGWVHRDIKLANVVLRLDGQWMVIDLELAAKLDERGEADWPFWDPRNNDVYPMPPRVGEERWKPKHDIYHVAMMLARIPVFQYHPRRQDLVDTLENAGNAQEAMDIVSRFSF